MGPNAIATTPPQVHALYALLGEYGVRVPDVDKAGYASLGAVYGGLKAAREEVEAGREAAVAKYSGELEAGASRDGC